ncbi:MAG: tetratricopeptide repeat protein [Armatimonadetes bacterium]|nr:tetratricopeptide repeat protein [Armatimonadota bacterium]
MSVLVEVLVFGVMAPAFIVFWAVQLLRENRIERGIWLARHGRREDALKTYEKAIRFAPRYAPAHVAKGRLLIEMRNLEAGMAAFRKATVLDAQCTPAYEGLAVTLWQSGRYEEAAAMWRKAIAVGTPRRRFGRTPGYPWGSDQRAFAFTRVADCLSELGRHDEAWEALEEAERLTPKFPPVHFEMARTLARTGDLQGAAARIRRYLALTRGDPTWGGRAPSGAREFIEYLGTATELEAAAAPAGSGTEPEAAAPPPGRGTELEALPSNHPPQAGPGITARRSQSDRS